MKDFRGKEASFSSRLEDRLKADEKKKALLERFREGNARRQQLHNAPPQAEGIEVRRPDEAKNGRREEPAFAAVRYGKAQVTLYERDDPASALHLEPWVRHLVNLVHQTYAQGGVHACLLWPASMPPLPLVHAVATWERLAVGDLRGLRTLLFPTKATTFYELNHLLADRRRVVKLVQEQGDSSGRISPVRDVAGKADLLMALSTIEIHSPEVPYPTIAELVPTFTYDPGHGNWGDYSEKYFARCLRKLKPGHARNLRSKISGGLADPATAPDALFGVPYGTRRDDLKRIAGSKVFRRAESRPDLIILDGSADIQKTAFRTVQKLPEALRALQEGMEPNLPVLFVTDDPITFFTFRKRMREEAGVDVSVHVFPAEGDGSGLSGDPRPATWVPRDRVTCPPI